MGFVGYNIRTEDHMNLEALTRFQHLDVDFQLTKLKTKRPSSVRVGKSEVGRFKLLEFQESSEGPAGVAVVVYGYNFLKTSPVIKIVDQDDKSTTFETEGGFYKLSKL